MSYTILGLYSRTSRFLAGLFVLAPSRATATPVLAELIKNAKAGQTIELPEGTFRGGVVLPPGVSLKGAGFDKTIIEAGGAEYGLSIVGGSDAVVADLSIRGAQRTNLIVRRAKNLTLSGLRLSHGVNGVILEDVEKGGIENCIVAHNRYGIIVSGGSRHAVMNCTLADNFSMGMSFPSGRQSVAALTIALPAVKWACLLPMRAKCISITIFITRSSPAASPGKSAARR